MNRLKWEQPSCTICETKKYLKLFYKGITTWELPGTFDYVKCGRCGLVFQSPRAPFNEIGKYYPPEHYWGWGVVNSGRNINKIEDSNNRYEELYKEIFKRYPKPGRILDIGTGTGLFLTKFFNCKWHVEGTEISPEAAAYAKKRFGFSIRIGDLPSLDLPNDYYDVIVLNGVLEHVYNPRKTLQKIYRLLKANGLVVILVPNIMSLGHLMLRREWYHLQPGKHIYHFNPHTINLLLSKCDFIIEHFVGSNWTHDYYGMFNIMRYRFSPKFRKSPSGGLASGTIEDIGRPSQFSLFKELGKSVVLIFAYFAALLERFLGRGEVMVIYARKRGYDGL